MKTHGTIQSLSWLNQFNAYRRKNEDTWNNSVSSTGGTYDLDCIGTGILKLPSGNYNALLVKIKSTEGDILDLDIFYWYDSDNGSLLLSYILPDDLFVPEPILRYQTTVIVENEDLVELENAKYNSPISDIVNISFNNNHSHSVLFMVSDLNGRTIYSKRKNCNIGNIRHSIDLSKFENGIYFISIFDSENNYIVNPSKLIKM